MDINAVNIATIMRMVNTSWQRGQAWKPPIDIGFLFQDFPSASAANFYPWLDNTPKYREWIGERVFSNVMSRMYEVVNRIFEKSERMPATAIKDDTWGVYTTIIQGHGSAWEQLKYDIVLEVLLSNPLSFTGKALFANDHAYGEHTIDNLTDQALSRTTFEAAFTAASEWQYSNGVLIRPTFTHLLHGPKMRSTAFGIVDAEKINDGNNLLIDNPNYKRCQRVEIPDFAGDYDDYWCLVDGSQPIRPIARQIREVPVPKMDNDPLHVERTGNLDWMSSGRLAAAPTFPHMMYGGRL